LSIYLVTGGHHTIR